jgi:hypothetical protein
MTSRKARFVTAIENELLAAFAQISARYDVSFSWAVDYNVNEEPCGASLAIEKTDPDTGASLFYEDIDLSEIIDRLRKVGRRAGG